MEEIIFDDYDEYEVENTLEMKAVKNHRYSSGIRKCALALALAVVVSTGFSAVPGKFNNMATVEAARKKDKKKPVIKFSGKSNIRVTQNESVKIPKATAKDNVDGNVTKKIKVSVKSGKKSYSALAKKIQKNKAVKFTKTGKYTITYTVSDKAKNKATKKRTVTVVAKQEGKKTTENKTTVEQTTENKTTTEQVTAAATTEATTTESGAEQCTNPLYKQYDIKRINVNGNYYNVTRDYEFSYKLYKAIESPCDKMTINVEHDYDSFMSESDSGINIDSRYLGYLGKITAMDEEGNDISDNVVIVEVSFVSGLVNSHMICIYVEDSKGNCIKKDLLLNFDFIDPDGLQFLWDMNPREYKMIDSDPLVYARLRQDIESKDENYANDMRWNLDEEGVLVISGNGAMSADFIPWESVKKSIKKVVIEEGITNICENAFSDCPLLTEIQFANSIKEIEKDAFYNSFNVDNANIPPLVIPGNVEVIGEDAFKCCTGLTQVIMEEGVKDIQIGAFYGCSNLETIDFPKSISTIEYDVFTATKWKQSQIQDTDVVIVNDILLYIRANTEIPQTITSIQGDGFAYREDIQNVEIPDNVKRIGDTVFMECPNLNTVKIPDSVTQIGEFSFSVKNNITIECGKNSYAYSYAQRHGMKTK